MFSNFVLITGCPGGGKSMLLDALSSRGYATISEPGRRIVAAQIAGTGKSLPWIDIEAFAHAALDMARSDLASADSLRGLVFFDRGLVDAAVALQFAGGAPYLRTLGDTLQYSKTVFLAPPWPKIFTQDEARKHDFKSATEEYHRIEAALIHLGYDVCALPNASVEDRVDFALNQLRIR